MIKIDSNKTILEFGTGDIGFNSGAYESESGKVGAIVFYNQEPREIGAIADNRANTEVDLNDFPVLMTFYKKESIDILIKSLLDAKNAMD